MPILDSEEHMNNCCHIFILNYIDYIDYSDKLFKKLDKIV